MGVEILALPFRASPEPPQFESLVDSYMNAVREVVLWCIQTGNTNLSRVHKALYQYLKEKYDLKARYALDAIRHDIAIAKSWLRNQEEFQYSRQK